MNTEIVKPLAFAKGFWLIFNDRNLIKAPESNAGRKIGRGSNKKVIDNMPSSKASIDAVIAAVTSKPGLTRSEISKETKLSIKCVIGYSLFIISLAIALYVQNS